jgi:pimeloyl-ACP methyl ester carboxylesterase
MLPSAINDLTESTSVTMARAIEFASIETSLAAEPIPTSYVCQGTGQPVVMIHGFDSSLLEFRRLLPPLATTYQAWALDLLGFGFTDRTLSPRINPTTIKLHLYQFWQQCIGQPMVLVGASMGGAAAIDFTLTYPEAVTRLVLIDSAGFAAGPALGKWMVPPLDSWATAFLRNPGVRRRISQQAYCDRTLVTADAELCTALHLAMPGWKEALITFTKSNGYNFLSQSIAKIHLPTLVLWGEQDRILGTRDATRFQQTLPDGQLVWVPECGHVPHLENPQFTAETIRAFLK